MIKLTSDTTNVTLQNDAATILFRISHSLPDHAILDIDLYRAGRREHPESHLGWWKFPVTPGEYSATIQFSRKGLLKSVSLIQLPMMKNAVPAIESWSNPNCTTAPNQDLLFILRSSDLSVLHSAHIQLIVNDSRFLKQFYEQLHRRDHTPNPFLESLHNSKLKQLSRIFKKNLPDGYNVLDIGSAYSVLSQTRSLPDLTVICADIGEELVLKRSRELPRFLWTVSDARHLPFAPQSFDAVFAGEIIEHFIDDEIPKLLSHWRDLLKANGILILTTPNRLRWLNRINRSNAPFGPDHFREFSLPELRDLLHQNGFNIIHETGVYIELLANYSNRPNATDLLQNRYNKQVYSPLMRLLGGLGRWFPKISLDLIIIASKQAAVPVNLH